MFSIDLNVIAIAIVYNDKPIENFYSTLTACKPHESFSLLGFKQDFLELGRNHKKHDV